MQVTTASSAANSAEMDYYTGCTCTCTMSFINVHMRVYTLCIHHRCKIVQCCDYGLCAYSIVYPYMLHDWHDCTC